MITMGIDASTKSTGWSIFDNNKLIDYGLIQPKGEDWRDRLVNQGPVLIEIIKKYRPEKIFLEDVPPKPTPKINIILGAVQGFLIGLIAQFNIPIIFLLPSEWRSPLGLYDGTRKGTKRDELKRKSVLKANELFDLNLIWKSPKSKFNEDDIADSILIAYSQVKERKLRKKKH